jgi:class 3 adenylate cyclase
MNKDTEQDTKRAASTVASLQVVFTDIVKYSLRSAYWQQQIISEFTKMCSQTIEAVLREYSSTLGTELDDLNKQVICIPTGDGVAIGFILPQLTEIHFWMVQQLAHAIELHNKNFVCEEFAAKGWCNCHPTFIVRFGVSEGKAILYTDINGQRNIAGTPINEAARIMGLAGPMQVLFSEPAFRTLSDLSQATQIKDTFRRFQDIEVKHGVKYTVYQYIGPDTAIDSSIPPAIDATGKLRGSTIARSYTDFANAAIELVNQFGVKESVEVLKVDTRWAFQLIPSLASARLKGKRVRVLCQKSDDAQEMQRVGLLARMGCEVGFLKNPAAPELEMFLFDSSLAYWQRGMVLLKKHTAHSKPFGVFYERGTDQGALRLFLKHFNEQWDQAEKVTLANSGTKIKQIDVSEIVTRLRAGVAQYASSNVSITMEEVQLTSLSFLTSKLYEWKYRQIPLVLELYESLGAGLFDPLALSFADDKISIMTPPVVEERDGRLVVLNGSHRSYYCRKNGIAGKIRCLLVKGVKEPLPVIPVAFENVRIESEEPPLGSRIVGFDYSRFRHVESSVHPPEEMVL